MLIYDIGANNGDDTDFYLRKGFRVVAIEPNPKHVAFMQRRFVKEIASGDAVIIGKAALDRQGVMSLYVHDHDDWSTLTKNDRFTEGNHAVVSVDVVPLADLLRQYGNPYYVKIDIEGPEKEVVESMLGGGFRPRFVSVEINPQTPQILARLQGAGYTAFKVIDQALKCRVSQPVLPSEGRFAETTFTGLMSGPFGEEAYGEWVSADLAMAYTREILSGRLRSWYDLHAKLDHRWE